MDETVGTRYWCHMCSQIVSPLMEVEVKCPTCQGGFIEEVEASNDRDVNRGFNEDAMVSDFGMSLWVPLMLGMMGGVGSRLGPRSVRVHLVPRRDGSRESIEEENGERGGSENENENEMNDRRRRRSSAAILEMLQGIRDQMASESDISNGESREREQEGGRRGRVILINPFNHTIIVQGSYNDQGEAEAPPLGSLGDYFFGPSLDTLLQHLAENDPNRYGTPPAKKEAIDAMPIVKVQDNVQCSVCLEDFEVGSEAKEMPCKHKFHDECIKPWLELHSSCPLCRHQLPADESKIGASRTESGNTNVDSNHNHGGEETATTGVRFTIPWPFNALFSFRGTTASDSGSSDDSRNNGANSDAGER